MENAVEFVWEKYNERLTEIENKLAVKKGVFRPQEQLLAANHEAAPEADGRARVETVINNLIVENQKLKEETRFLKAENDGMICLKEEISRLKEEFKQKTFEKDAEISRLYTKNKRLEEEAGSLRVVIHRRSLAVLEDAANPAREKSSGPLYNGMNSNHCKTLVGAAIPVGAKANDNMNGSPERTGILEWLSKPLIVVKTDKR
jgi:hypothetical protein